MGVLRLARPDDRGRAAFFLNCICYIRQFDGKQPLVHRRSTHRQSALTLAGLTFKVKDAPWFSKDLTQKYQGDPDGLVNYCREHLELMFYEGNKFSVDQHLVMLGIASNRKLETLDKSEIVLLEEPSKWRRPGRCWSAIP